MKKYQIGIIGSAGDEEYLNKEKQRTRIYKTAKKLGQIVASKGAILITGGKGGIMESANKGAKSKNGITVGFVRGKERFTSNDFTDIEVVSGMEGCGEETMLILSCDGIIAVGGGAGTLQELSIAYRNKKPVVILDCGYGWASKLANSYLDERRKVKFYSVKTPEKAINLLLKLIK
jgi:uncharacterized protein (TIGR00725 family)